MYMCAKYNNLPSHPTENQVLTFLWISIPSVAGGNPSWRRRLARTTAAATGATTSASAFVYWVRFILVWCADEQQKINQEK